MTFTAWLLILQVLGLSWLSNLNLRSVQPTLLLSLVVLCCFPSGHFSQLVIMYVFVCFNYCLSLISPSPHKIVKSMNETRAVSYSLVFVQLVPGRISVNTCLNVYPWGPSTFPPRLPRPWQSAWGEREQLPLDHHCFLPLPPCLHPLCQGRSYFSFTSSHGHLEQMASSKLTIRGLNVSFRC